MLGPPTYSENEGTTAAAQPYPLIPFKAVILFSDSDLWPYNTNIPVDI